MDATHNAGSLFLCTSYKELNNCNLCNSHCENLNFCILTLKKN